MIKNFKISGTLLILLVCTACTKDIRYHGYNLDKEVIKKIVPMKSTLNEVIENLGSPTTATLYGEPKFFYINHKYKRRLFLNPALIDQNILQISFTQGGTVTSIERYSFSDVKSFRFDEASTYLPGNNIGVLQQIIGNIGKYNNADGMRKAGT
ncbi:MAG: outer membrane protein assembly factor BamE [Candidatus Midichloria sp.]|nr:outer membrane protein assembly factor BamE [Candidatus Midichloria sp.]